MTGLAGARGWCRLHLLDFVQIVSGDFGEEFQYWRSNKEKRGRKATNWRKKQTKLRNPEAIKRTS
jgi:hypothetical protein